jgi:Tfp pilus assembly protein PilO
MALPPQQSYKLEYSRYRHYFHRLWIFYQKPAVKVSSALLMTLFTIIFFAAFAIRPTLVTVAELIKKIDDQKQVLDSMKKKSAALASAQQDYLYVQDTLPLLNTAVPQTEDLPVLIKMIEGIVAYHELALNSLTFGDLSIVGPDAPQLRGAQTRTLTLSISADYPKLASFISDFTRLPRLFTIDTLAFAAPLNNQNSQASLQVTITGKVHFLPRDTVAIKK